MSFHGFIGQRRLVEHMKVQIAGAQALGQPCPHVLVIGSSGMGKTRLVKSMAAEAGTDYRVVHGKAAPADLCEEMVQLNKGDFLILDEAHSLPRDSQEYIYEAVDTWRITDRLKGNGQAQQSGGKIVVQPFTVALVTDQPSGLLGALHRRMEVTLHLHRYRAAELEEIAGTEAAGLRLLFDRPTLARDFLREHRPDVVVYLTDGFGPAPAAAPPVPVVWCIAPGGEKPAPWGRAVYLK